MPTPETAAHAGALPSRQLSSAAATAVAMTKPKDSNARA
jgi:hypothetical protein